MALSETVKRPITCEEGESCGESAGDQFEGRFCAVLEGGNGETGESVAVGEGMAREEAEAEEEGEKEGTCETEDKDDEGAVLVGEESGSGLEQGRSGGGEGERETIDVVGKVTIEAELEEEVEEAGAEDEAFPSVELITTEGGEEEDTAEEEEAKLKLEKEEEERAEMELTARQKEVQPNVEEVDGRDEEAEFGVRIVVEEEI